MLYVNYLISVYNNDQLTLSKGLAAIVRNS